MNMQEFIDQKLRLALGNMHVELILAQARITDLEEQLAKAMEPAEQAAVPEVSKPNGRSHLKETQP